MTLTPIRRAVETLSPDARRTLLNYQDEVGTSIPLGTPLLVMDELFRVRAIDLDGRLLPFGLMLRAVVLELELDTMDPPTPDPRDELVAAAKTWYAEGSPDQGGEMDRLIRAIRGLS